mgnify:CR=1 FL=1|tara:strand:+ start:454 stop:699 length:246 start_codon:yes stop_codon:yes gene_type:complete
MNEYLFAELIHPWIPDKDLPVTLNRRYSEKLGLKIQTNISSIEELYLDIYIHACDPCYRYCICAFFSNHDKRKAKMEAWYH